MKSFLYRSSALFALSMVVAMPLTTHALTLSLSQKLKGRIVLQVENNGEAWYIRPDNQLRLYMGRPSDAFELMRSLGLGISNADLKKISVGVLAGELGGRDADDDGIFDGLEQVLGLDWRNADTDGDGYKDLDELQSGNDPFHANMQLPIDIKLTQKLSGKILLQVEAKGEAWYINPTDSKRYYLGRPNDAFFIMRSLGLGISNIDLAKISEGRVPAVQNEQAAYINTEYGFQIKPNSAYAVVVKKSDMVERSFLVQVFGGNSYGADLTGTMVTVMYLSALPKTTYTLTGDILLKKGQGTDQLGFNYLGENNVYYFGTESVQDSAGFPEWIINGYKNAGAKSTLGVSMFNVH